ncbi:MAG TPA: N-acetylmuramoyl-L-alanine amidase [Actinomycetota bacterium]|nr:N-acetylmuramoyl-L-alanine amidase [Actinomycetota bacterium]
MQIIGRGHRGHEVRDVQSRLLALGFSIDPREVQDHSFGPSTEATVRAFQQERGLLVDGLLGEGTWSELVEAGYALGDRVLYHRHPFFRGDDVRALQRRLNHLGFDPGREDGIFGEQTGQAVRDFQVNVGLHPDGIVGASTTAALDRFLSAPTEGPGRVAIRETERLAAPGSLRGRRVAIDAGHGPDDPGVEGPTGLREGDAAYVLAERLAANLAGRGAIPVLVRGRQETPDAAARAARANRAEADVLVGIHLNGHEDPSAEGSSSYYFGRLGTSSVGGQALAELVQDELTAATGLRDGRAHPKAFTILRETRMPAVIVEPCFITNPKEERLLSEQGFQREVARAISVALERYFSGRRRSADERSTQPPAPGAGPPPPLLPPEAPPRR